jgi:cytochrome c
MHRSFVLTLALMLGSAVTTGAGAAVVKAEKATAKEAEAMVKKGVAYVKANGRAKAFAEINNKGGQFVDRDLYLGVIQLDGLILAHGANEKLIGKNTIDTQDVDGKKFINDWVEAAKTKGSFWYDFKLVNPVTKKIEPKSEYCERLDDMIICGGIYKPV